MDPNVGEADREGPKVGETEFIQLEHFLPQTVKLKNPSSAKKSCVRKKVVKAGTPDRKTEESLKCKEALCVEEGGEGWDLIAMLWLPVAMEMVGISMRMLGKSVYQPSMIRHKPGSTQICIRRMFTIQMDR